MTMPFKRRCVEFCLLVTLAIFAAGNISCGGGTAAPAPPSPTASPDYSLSATPSTVSLSRGGSGVSVSVTATALNGFNQNVIVNILGLPSGVTSNPASPFSVGAGAAQQLTITASAAAGTGSFPLTLSGASGTLNHSAGISVTIGSSAPGNAVQLTVQTSQQLQTWKGWAANPPRANYTINGVNTPIPAGVLSAALDDAVNDLGINMVRVEQLSQQGVETTNDNSDPNSINWAAFNFNQTFIVDGDLADPATTIAQVVVPLRQRVLARSEPFVLYISPVYHSLVIPAHWHTPAEYAEYAQAYVTWLSTPAINQRGFSLPPDFWVIYNEPDLGSIPASEVAADILAVGARFQSMGLSTKIQTAETVNPNIFMLNTVLQTPGVLPFVGMVSFHSYDYGYTNSMPAFTQRNQVRAAAQAAGVPTAMTENCCKPNWDGGYSTQGLSMARDIYWNMTEANVSVWQPLAMMGPCTVKGCPSGSSAPIALDSDLSAYFKFQPYYAWRQFSHFIRPGHQRISVTCGNCTQDPTTGQNVKPVAFQSPAGKITVVVINDQTASQNISISGLPAGTYDITGVDPVNSRTPVTYPTQTIGAGQAVNITFPAQSILTLVQR